MNYEKVLVSDGSKPILGRLVLRQYSGVETVDLQTFEQIFAENEHVPEKWKEKIEGNTLHIFCLETFPTPHREDDNDESVMYALWCGTFKRWVLNYWRVNDTWNVPVAVLTIADAVTEDRILTK